MAHWKDETHLETQKYPHSEKVPGLMHRTRYIHRPSRFCLCFFIFPIPVYTSSLASFASISPADMETTMVATPPCWFINAIFLINCLFAVNTVNRYYSLNPSLASQGVALPSFRICLNTLFISVIKFLWRLIYCSISSGGILSLYKSL